jgi:arginine deiminase
MDNFKIDVSSEIGDLETVILHNPGPEVENMTPRNAERALYSDILNLAVAKKEYTQLKCILGRFAQTLYVEDLLEKVLEDTSVMDMLVRNICLNEHAETIVDELLQLSPKILAQQLIQGVPIKRNSLTNFLDKNNYSLRPLHNFFFTRDGSMTLYNNVLIGKMASKIRHRESMIMQSIFDYHPQFNAKTINPIKNLENNSSIKIEGGDLLIAREDIIIIGIGARTSPQGVDFILNRLREKKDTRHIIVQELPYEPESFIHLDMAFTLLDRNSCMVYEPLILRPNKYETVHIKLENGEVKSIQNVKNIPEALSDLGMDMELVYCGGRKNSIIQEREQWHSGANFFAVGPGKVLGYSRNVHTLEDMNQNGYEILRAKDVLAGKVNPEEYKRFVITIDGSELARGGGGARCMTMPVKRKKI